MSYLLSIVVPTKNRYKYLKSLIQLIDSFKTDEIELVIQDNSDNNSEIISFLEQFKNKNIKYYYSVEKLTMSENSDLSILKSQGEYVCFIGDDDGVTRNIINCAKWMKDNYVESIFSNCTYYNWSGKASVINKRCKIIRHDAIKEIKLLLKRGMILNETKLPLLYHAIVKREVLNNIYKKYNTFFLSTPPDISSAISLAFEITNYYEINIPIIINGTSEMTGGGVIRKGGVINLNEVEFINDDDRKEWEKSIPPIWCGSYAWLNSGIKTLRSNNKESYVRKINTDYNLAHAISLRPQKIILYKNAWKFKNNFWKLISYVFILLFMRVCKKIKSKIIKNIIVKGDLKTIIDAEEFFYLSSKDSLSLFTLYVKK